MSRRRVLVAIATVAALAGLCAALAPTRSGAAGSALRTRAATGQAVARPALVPHLERPAAFAVSVPLRDLARTVPSGSGLGDEEPESGEQGFPEIRSPRGASDPVVQRHLGAEAAPQVGASFEGLSQAVSPPRYVPPDTVGAIGKTAYVQMVNVQIAVYARDGRRLLGPLPYQALFGPLGGSCGILDHGDPVVLYDQLADRFVLSQFGFLDVDKGPFYECIAVSKTGDPTGGYYLYAFKISDTELNDYPKLSVWPDAYYFSANTFNVNAPFVFTGSVVAAFDRTAMLAGDPDAAMVKFALPFTDQVRISLLPASLDGFRLPPAGEPETYVQLGFDIFQGPKPELDLYHFHVDWSNPAASSFTPAGTLATAPYNAFFCDSLGDPCIAQKGAFQTLDPLSDRLMFRAAYRNLGDHEALVVNHTVNVGGDQAGVRWYEVRNPGRTPTLYDQGTFAPDDESRWMASAAMDGNGDLALGYSVSGKDLYAGVRFTARRAGDPLGEMTLGEGSLVEGGGAQTHPSGRWGDYSALTVDPLDDCTFWYTQEYYPGTTERDWHTRIGSFIVQGCDATAPQATARAAKARAGARVALRYRTQDNSGRTREEITIFRPNGRRLRTIEVPLHAAGEHALRIAAPRPAGRYRWQVVAFDARGNESRPSIAPLRTT